MRQIFTTHFKLPRLCLIGTCVLLAACSTPQKHHRWNPNGAPQIAVSPAASIMKYDANHDGILTRQELETGLKADFDAFDTKHTGCLTPDQVTAINEARATVDQAASSPLIDWKHNNSCVDFDDLPRRRGRSSSNSTETATASSRPTKSARPNREAEIKTARRSRASITEATTVAVVADSNRVPTAGRARTAIEVRWVAGATRPTEFRHRVAA